MNIIAPIFAIILSLNYIGGFREGDWVNFSDFRFITSVAMDQTVVYFGTTNGVIRYDRFANRWLDPMTITDGLPSRRIDNIAYDYDSDRIYVQTPLGNAYYQPTFKQWYSAEEFPERLAKNDFSPSSLGLLNTEYGYTYQDGIITDFDLRTFRLTRGVDDGFNRLFVGTWGMGPVIINPRYGDIKRIPYGPYSEDASAFVKIGDKFWMGAATGGADDPDPGLTLLDTSLQNWQWFVPNLAYGLNTANISSAIADKKAFWLGTDYGLIFYEGDGDNFTTYSDFAPLPSVRVTSLAADSAWIYIGTDFGLAYVSRDNHFKRRKSKNKEADSLSEDSTEAGAPLSGKNRLRGFRINNLKVINDYLYVASDRGVLRRKLEDYGDFEYVNTPERMLSDDILDIAQSGDSLLFATKNDIIVINSKTGLSSSLTNMEHFGQWSIRKIQVDTLNIWAATSAGLWKYRLRDGAERLFTSNDGMISSDIRSLEIVGDYIWMATQSGAIRFLWNRPGRID